jgi:ketosteroid isomerase-like protein
MKRFTIVLFVLAAFILLASMQVFAQEWSAAQKDVWKNVEAYTALGMEKNLEGFLEYFHTDYCGWEYGDPMPTDKSDVRRFLEHTGWKTRTILTYDVKPVAIKIHGDVAFVHYYYTTIYKDAEGKEKSSAGRWTDILMKQGNKWVMIGDHGGQTSKE